MNEQEYVGFVERFLGEKGYGFIRTPAFNVDLFVHHTAIVATGFRTLECGDRVRFTVRRTEKGVLAENVRVIG